MKKIIIVSLIFLIILSGVKTESKFSLLNYFSGDYTVYTSDSKGEDGVDLGFCYMNSKHTTGNIIAESMVIENLEIGNALETLNARVVKTEYLDDGTSIIYAHTILIDDSVEISEGRVNLQIATRDERSVIGWPLILGSY